jgi:hypothetical protein
VNLHVRVESIALGKPHSTNFTGVRSFSRMNPYVNLQSGRLPECLATVHTTMILLPCVNPPVRRHV